MSKPDRILNPWQIPPDEIQRSLRQRFDVVDVTYRILDTEFQILAVRDGYALLSDAPDIVERIPYWAEIWPSAIALAETLVQEPSLKSSSVLELGSGLGLVSIVAAHRGAKVHMTDYDEMALCFGAVNADLNDVSISLSRFDWCGATLGRRFDFVLAADVLYSEENIEPVSMCLVEHLKDGGCALVADPQRAHSRRFLRRVNNLGLAVFSKECSVSFQDRKVVVDLHRLTHRR